MRITFALAVASIAGLVTPSQAFDLAGRKQISLVSRDGTTIPIGHVDFTPSGGKTSFKVDIDTSRFQTFFLSMRDFKCVVGPELECYVPYPYANPSTVTASDLAWLEHALLFFYKDPKAYGASLNNGLIYDLKVTDHGIEGPPQAIDLNAIASPPADLTTPPYGSDMRDAIPDGSRWISKLTITDAPTSR